MPQSGGSAACAATQLIVRFRAVPEPSDPAFLASLSETLGTSIAYVRPMSGGAHVLRVDVEPDAVADVIRRLETRPEVVAVQPDVRVRPQ